jgi:hypothetical protein
MDTDPESDLDTLGSKLFAGSGVGSEKIISNPRAALIRNEFETKLL